MLRLLWLIPAIPFASFIVLALVGPRISRKSAAFIGVTSIAVSTVVSILITWNFLFSTPQGGSYTQLLWTWIDVAGFRPQIAFYLDALSLIMTLVVTFVSFLIHLSSAESMIESEGYSRFFAYMNLFVASMVTLLLADNLLLLYLGWEGVGLCSYLLIGFWYTDPVNGLAARKAFIVTRVGDTAMIIGLFLLFQHLGTLHIQELMRRAAEQWSVGSALPTVAAALLLGGAVGKSAQLPLQTWLPDAMAGPTPTSALIHAATMVTAGVYLIARTHVLFSLAPSVQFTVAVIGAATLVLGGFSALTQWDIKRVLAYSTISQIGYMFLAMGVGAWAAGIFHFMTHAFFKSLLFLAAGVVIQATHEEHSIFKMGGLRKELPLAFGAFLIAGCSLAGLPLITAGFYSKGLIVWETWASPQGSTVLWFAGVFGVLLTSLYIFRVIFLVFFGEAKASVTKRPGYKIQIPLIVLTVLSVVGGFVNLPPKLGNAPLFTRLLNTALPPVEQGHFGPLTEMRSEGFLAFAFLIGLGLSYLLYLRNRQWSNALIRTHVGKALHEFWFADWGFDWCYDKLFVQPILWFARIDKGDVVDAFYKGIADLSELLYRGLSLTENGRVRWYAAGIAGGTVVFVAIALFL
ncbi:MAG TPA: NADH-quinone oxidoreductase subunit L [Terriglobales bacterium]|nr:NADH-quinone oxidoreductase subunit L [Terriglobales bacterium]